MGVELRLERVDGKAKLSQNRSAEDQDGVITGLSAKPGPDAAAVADTMRALRAAQQTPRKRLRRRPERVRLS